MKVESIAVVILTICIFLSFYFAFLSFQEIDVAVKKQLLTFTAYSLIAGRFSGRMGRFGGVQNKNSSRRE
jgi:hypothetical protein